MLLTVLLYNPQTQNTQTIIPEIGHLDKTLHYYCSKNVVAQVKHK